MTKAMTGKDTKRTGEKGTPFSSSSSATIENKTPTKRKLPDAATPKVKKGEQGTGKNEGLH